MRRVRQFGDVRDSRCSSTSKLTTADPFAPKLQKTANTHSTYLCVDCVNHSLSKQKHQKKEIERADGSRLRNHWQKTVKQEEERERLSKAKKIENERRHLTEGNLTLSRFKNHKEEQKKMRKIEELQEQQRQLQCEDKKKAAQLQRQKLLKQTWKQSIKDQVAVKERQKIQERQQKLRQSPDKAIFHSNFTKFQQQYKNLQKQLSSQIAQKQERKINQRKQNNRTICIQSMPIVDEAEQREKYYKKVQEQRKRMLIEEAKKKHEQKKEEKQEQQLRNKVQRMQYEQRLQTDYEKVHRQMRKKREQMNEYLADIKRQISQKNIQKLSQKAQNNSIREECILPLRRKMSTKDCDNCSKSVEKMYLTRFVS